MRAPLGEQSGSLSFGEALRRERELRRIPLRDVSEATKINIRYLEALERNEFTYLPAGAFTRGFIRSYARYVGTDESEMINAYLYEIGRQERKGAPREGSHGMIHFMQARDSKRGRRRLLLALLVAVALLAVAAIAIPILLHHRAPAPVASGASLTHSP